MPADDEMPDTIKRSPESAQRTWAKAHDNAVESYGEGERAHRTAYAALKHTHEKIGDHWEPKDHKGPSDPGAKGGGPDQSQPTYGGVDVESRSKKELYRRAKELGIKTRSDMTKQDLARAIARKQS